MRWLRWHLCWHLGKAAAGRALRGEGRALPVSTAVQCHLAGSGPPGPVPEALAPRPAQTPTPDAARHSRRSGPRHTCPCGGPWGSLAWGRAGHVAFRRSLAELAAALSIWGASAGGAPTACPLAPESPCVAGSLCPRARPPGSRSSPHGRDSTEVEALGCGQPRQPPDPPQAGPALSPAAFWPAAVLVVACVQGAGMCGTWMQGRPGLLPSSAGAWGPGHFCWLA